MQPKLKICDECNTEKVIWKNYEGRKLCLGCWNKIKPKTSSVFTKKPKAIKQFSDKRKAQNAKYKILRDEFLSNNPYCQAGITYVCTRLSTEVHHSKGRIGNNLTDIIGFVALCRECHLFCELHPKIAKQMGLSKDRL